MEEHSKKYQQKECCHREVSADFVLDEMGTADVDTKSIISSIGRWLLERDVDKACRRYERAAGKVGSSVLGFRNRAYERKVQEAEQVLIQKGHILEDYMQATSHREDEVPSKIKRLGLVPATMLDK